MTEGEVDRIVKELQNVEKNQSELTRKVDQIHQGIYGIPGTDDKGFFGELKAIKDQVRRIIMALCFTAGGGGLSAAIIKLLSG